jgi:Putative phage serine protease XkdF
MSTMRELLATDETFREVADLLFGGGADELIAKMNPSQSDLAAKKDKTKRMVTAGLSAVGATAGAAGLGYAAHKTGGAYRAARATQRASGIAHAIGAKRVAAKQAIRHEKFGAALVPLEVAGLGGELMATKILHGDTKKHGKIKPIKKDLGELLNNSKEIPTTKGQLTMAAVTSPKARKKGIEYSKKTGGMLRKLPDKVKTVNQVEKRGAASRDTEIDVVWEGEFAKADADKQQIFGWASVVEVDGQPVVDLQGDYISNEEMEKAGYEYVMKSRKGGDMHLRDDWQPIQKSEMIESFIVTPEKRDAMGLPDSVPSGWWVGFQVRDPEVWSKVKSGERTGFSIHGHGRRSPLDS